MAATIAAARASKRSAATGMVIGWSFLRIDLRHASLGPWGHRVVAQGHGSAGIFAYENPRFSRVFRRRWPPSQRRTGPLVPRRGTGRDPWAPRTAAGSARTNDGRTAAALRIHQSGGPEGVRGAPPHRSASRRPGCRRCGAGRTGRARPGGVHRRSGRVLSRGCRRPRPPRRGHALRAGACGLRRYRQVDEPADAAGLGVDLWPKRPPTLGTSEPPNPPVALFTAPVAWLWTTLTTSPLAASQLVGTPKSPAV